MRDDNLQEPLQPLSSMLDHVVTESVGEHLAWQWGNGDSGALSLEDVAEVFEVRVSATHGAVLQFKCGDIGATDNFVVGVHATRSAMCLRIPNLQHDEKAVSGVVRSTIEAQCISWKERWGKCCAGRRLQTSISRKFSGGP